MATSSNALPQLNLPASFRQLFKEICRGFFRNFFKDTLKALLATAFALYLPNPITYIEEQNLLNSQIILFLKVFVIAPGNMLKGCLLSSAVILTVFSFFNKVWMVGIFKSIGRFFGGGLSYLNIFRNSATSAFAWGLIMATAAGQFIENPFLSLTLIAAGFMAGVVPQGSGLVYFARFFWNRFYATTVLKSCLKPADEFIRGTSAGFTLALVFKGIEAGAKAVDGRLTTDFELLQNLRFADEITTTSEHAAKGFTTAGIEFKASIEGWEIELERCRLIIDKLPDKHRARLHAMVNKRAIKQKMLDIQSDKFALKEINKWPKDIRRQYNKEIGKLYSSIDKRVKKKIIQDPDSFSQSDEPQEQPAPQTGDALKCKSCGKINTRKVKFCTECGQAVD